MSTTIQDLPDTDRLPELDLHRLLTDAKQRLTTAQLNLRDALSIGSPMLSERAEARIDAATHDIEMFAELIRLEGV